MQRMLSFASTPAVVEALDVALGALRERQPGQKVTKSDAMRVAIVALANSVQRAAPAPAAGEAAQ